MSVYNKTQYQTPLPDQYTRLPETDEEEESRLPLLVGARWEVDHGDAAMDRSGQMAAVSRVIMADVRAVERTP